MHRIKWGALLMLLFLCGCGRRDADITRSIETLPPCRTAAPTAAPVEIMIPAPEVTAAPEPTAACTPVPTEKPSPTPMPPLESAPASEPAVTPTASPEQSEKCTYILNTNTKKFHKPSCGSVQQMKAENRQEYTGTREDLLEQGYTPCGNCKP